MTFDRRRLDELVMNYLRTPGKELYLFDVEIDLARTMVRPDGRRFTAFVTMPGERAIIAQIPWAVVSGAFQQAYC
jgi:hypothetical protein